MILFIALMLYLPMVIGCWIYLIADTMETLSTGTHTESLALHLTNLFMAIFWPVYLCAVLLKVFVLKQ